MLKPARNKPRRARTAPRWGGARAGAGRPPSGPRSSEPHKTRPAIDARHPVVVVARVAEVIRRLDRARAALAIERAISLSLDREDFRIIHLALRSSTVELVVEADDKRALARGMQGFQVSAARSFNRALHRRGAVFVDRYRAHVITTRPALAAVIERLPRVARTRIVQPTSRLFR